MIFWSPCVLVILVVLCGTTNTCYVSNASTLTYEHVFNNGNNGTGKVMEVTTSMRALFICFLMRILKGWGVIEPINAKPRYVTAIPTYCC